MNIFDTIQNLLSNVTSLGQNPIETITKEVTENPITQNLQDQATSISETLSDPLGAVTENKDAIIDSITERINQ